MACARRLTPTKRKALFCWQGFVSFHGLLLLHTYWLHISDSLGRYLLVYRNRVSGMPTKCLLWLLVNPVTQKCLGHPVKLLLPLDRASRMDMTNAGFFFWFFIFSLKWLFKLLGVIMFHLPSHSKWKHHAFPLLLFRHSEGMFLLIQDQIVLSRTLHWG